MDRDGGEGGKGRGGMVSLQDPLWAPYADPPLQREMRALHRQQRLEHLARELLLDQQHDLALVQRSLTRMQQELWLRSRLSQVGALTPRCTGRGRRGPWAEAGQWTLGGGLLGAEAGGE